MANIYGNLGNVEQFWGSLDAACSQWRQSYGLFVEIGAVPQIRKVNDLLRQAGCKGAPK